VAAGTTDSTNGQDFALARYNENGSLDTGFGTAGRVATDFGSRYDSALALALQADGKIVAAGATSAAVTSFALARYNTNGSLDTGFGSGGKVTTAFTDSHAGASAVKVQSDGKIVAAGDAQAAYSDRPPLSSDFAVARYLGDPTYSISGRVSDAQGAAIPNVAVERAGAVAGAFVAPVLTNAAGYFTLPNVPAGTYTITATKSNYTFAPVSRTLTVNNALVGNQNFIGKTGVTLSGRISTSASTGIAGVVVSRGASLPAVVTNGAGYYSFIGVQPGSVTVAPAKSGYRFTPLSKVVSIGANDVGNQNFIGATGYNVSGRIANTSGIGQSGISVKRTGSNVAVTTNGAGYYTFVDVPNGSVTITPTAASTSFTPEARTLVVNNADVSNQNFIAAPGYSIAGRIATSAGAPLIGVTVSRSGSSTTVLTNSAGYFLFTNVANGSYTITPAKSGSTFSPATKTVVVNGATASGQNFIGTP